MKCTKQELEDHLKETYSDIRRDEQMPPINGLKRPARPGIKFDLGNFKESELNRFIKKARSKSAPGSDGISYKVYKNCPKLKHLLFGLLNALWKKRKLLAEWCKAEGIYLPKQENTENISTYLTAKYSWEDLPGNASSTDGKVSSSEWIH